MTIVQAVLGVLIGLVAGVLSGLFGVGGGIVMTPGIQVLLQTSPIIALATPLPVILPTAFTGAILAYPTVRVRGVYLAVITIAFGLVFQNILVEWLSVTGGTQGLLGIPRGTGFGVALTRPIYFWVVAGFLLVQAKVIVVIRVCNGVVVAGSLGLLKES